MNIQEQFRDVDKDHSGFLTRDELKEAMVDNSHLEMTEAELDEFIADADTNRDGKISLQEWLDNFVGIFDWKEYKYRIKKYFNFTSPSADDPWQCKLYKEINQIEFYCFIHNFFCINLF